MNKRNLPCNKKQVLAIGQENSISDYKEKLLSCFDCYDFISCKDSQKILKGIIQQQNNIIILNKNKR